MIKTNYHTHTTRCKHAEGLDEAYVLAAIEAGFKEIGFSDHAPWPKHPLEHHQIRMELSEYNDYVQSIKRLQRQYANKIKINLGLEAEYYADRMDFMKKMLEETPLDYLVFGNHFHNLEARGHYYGNYSDTHNLVQHYKEDSLAGLKTGLFRIFAHPDLFVRSINKWTDEIDQMCREIILCAKEMNVVLEYNLGGIRNFSHLEYTFPYNKFWQIVAELKADVIIGIDAHSPQDFYDSNSIKKAEDYLSSIGIQIIDGLDIPIK